MTVRSTHRPYLGFTVPHSSFRIRRSRCPFAIVFVVRAIDEIAMTAVSVQTAPAQPKRAPSAAGLYIMVLLPFVLGYYLSYLFRTINAAIAGRLVTDLSLDAAQLGILTSAYFLSATVAQIPLGIAIDRYGPGRVQWLCLPIAAVGAYLFAIGLGVATALMSGLKAIVWWFPKERTALLNGCFIAAGATGALTAAAPVEWALQVIAWPQLFQILGAVTAVVALIIFLFVPKPETAMPIAATPNAPGLAEIFTDARFWRLAPASGLTIGSAWALQGLWVAPYLRDIARLDQAHIVQHLVVMAVTLCAGGLTFGILADRLARRGIGPKALFATCIVFLTSAEVLLALEVPVPTLVACGLIGAAGAGTVLSYTTTATLFPKEAIGRANSALNVLHFGGAWIVQSVFGAIVNLWPRDDAGHYPAVGFTVAFLLLAIAQLLALLWLVRPIRGAVKVSAVAVAMSVTERGILPLPANPGSRRRPSRSIAIGLPVLIATLLGGAHLDVSRLRTTWLSGVPQSVAIGAAPVDELRQRLSTLIAADASHNAQLQRMSHDISAATLQISELRSLVLLLQSQVAAPLTQAAVRPSAPPVGAGVGLAPIAPMATAAAKFGPPLSPVMATSPLPTCDQAAVHRGMPLVFIYEASTRDLDDRQTEVLRSLARDLRACPELRLAVTGHSDNRGSPDYNIRISQQRAALVVSQLSRHGIAPERIRALGEGAADPMADNASAAGRARNRRVEIRILPGI
jgi:outer membrane protein OmpA-like peptidoglycan-associated protein/sugar phosphate permease